MLRSHCVYTLFAQAQAKPFDQRTKGISTGLPKKNTADLTLPRRLNTPNSKIIISLDTLLPHCQISHHRATAYHVAKIKSLHLPHHQAIMDADAFQDAPAKAKIRKALHLQTEILYSRSQSSLHRPHPRILQSELKSSSCRLTRSLQL